MQSHGAAERRLNRQRRWISELLQDLSVVYWIDSGSLLGLMREGDLMPHDHDIDLGVWVDSHDVLMRHRLGFRRVGYKVRVFKYGGQPYKIQLIAGSVNGARNIDINFFRVHNEYAWCPQHIRRPGAVRHAVFWRYPLEWYWRTMRPSVSIDRYPWMQMRELWTWWIPRRFFDDCFVEASTGLSIPGDWEQYLSFRYGDWRVPKRDWDLTRDDRGLQSFPPDELLRDDVRADERFGRQ